MVTIAAHAPRATSGARVRLGALLADRDASLALKPRAFTLALSRVRRALGSVRSASVRVIVSLFALLVVALARHGLVLAGLTAFTTAAGRQSTTAALVVGGVGAFFLELRRR